MKLQRKAGVAVLVAALAATTGCSASAGTGGDSEEEITSLSVVYRESPFVTAVMEAAKTDFEALHPEVSVEFEPISASSSDYFTKVALMNQSKSTAADVIYEDGFNVTADAEAGYLHPLADQLADWDDWAQYSDIVRQNGTSKVDGEVYSIPLGTDNQAIWFNKDLFAQAGLPEDWQPESWQDILDAAAVLKEKLPDVIPLNMYTTKAAGEATTLRGMLNLISGTPGSLTDTLFDESDQKWVRGSQGVTDALTFMKTAYDDGYLPDSTVMQDSNLENVLLEQLVPNGEVAMFIDGSWIWSRWQPTGTKPWPEWADTLGLASLPTQDGEAPGTTSISGGWTLAMSSHAPNKTIAFDFMTAAASKENALLYALGAGSIPVRDDVATDEEYLSSNPTAPFFADLVQYTHFRPGLEVYPQVSGLIQETAEQVTVGGESVDDAVEKYDSQLERLVGAKAIKTAE